MQGKEIDMDKLISRNELTLAVGNLKVNARGDELGPGGQIIRKREDVVAAYYEDNAVAKVPKPTRVLAEADQAPVLEEGEEFIPSKKTKE
jgi:hypothetical protein